MDELVKTATELGLPGILIALVVIVGVFLAKRGKLVITGNQARIANIVLSAILSGLDPSKPIDERAIIAAIASISSALIFELYKALEQKLLPNAEQPRIGP